MKVMRQAKYKLMYVAVVNALIADRELSMARRMARAIQ